ncbi:MAG: hypothetical protein V8S95_05090 [Odoribacter sp.]
MGTFTLGGTYITKPAVTPKNIQLNHLKWEVVTQKNLGLDVALWKNNLMLTADIYDKMTDDLLQSNVKIFSATGFGTVNYFNSGKVRVMVGNSGLISGMWRKPNGLIRL